MEENINIEESIKRNAVVYENEYNGIKVLSVFPIGVKNSREKLIKFYTRLAHLVAEEELAKITEEDKEKV